MSKILAYIGLHFKLTFRKDKKTDIKSNIITFIMGIITCAVVLGLCKYLFDIIKKQMLTEISPMNFSVLIIFIIEIVLIVVGIFLEIKFFLKPSDVTITARFPLSTLQIFIAQLLIVYIYLFVVAFLLIVPMMMIFGWSVGIISVSFVFQTLLATLFAPLIPFAFATIFAVPAMFVLTLLENKNITKLILFLVALAVGFFLYSRVLNFLAEYYVHQRVDVNQKNLITVFINSLQTNWNFFTYTNNLVFGTQILKSIGIILSVTVVVLAVGVLISIPLYAKIRENILEGKQSIFSKKTKISTNSPFVAIFKNECKNIIRTHTYAYFYLGISIVTPIMVLLTNTLIKKVGTAQIGTDIVFGISLLTVLVFMSMISSFSASSISREGKEFYITKIVPVPYKTQLLAKGLLNAIVSFGALIISIVILWSMNFITILQCAIIFLSSLFIFLGIIFNGFNLNVRHPQINHYKAGEESQTNTTLAMFIGFFISAVEGLLSIVLNYFVNINYIYIMVISISLVYAVVNFLIFNFTTNKKYSQIE